eukprot:scaffold2527_cov241-Pinguiococcus_pyrenoidosus.AAC.10
MGEEGKNADVKVMHPCLPSRSGSIERALPCKRNERSGKQHHRDWIVSLALVPPPISMGSVRIPIRFDSISAGECKLPPRRRRE